MYCYRCVNTNCVYTLPPMSEVTWLTTSAPTLLLSSAHSFHKLLFYRQPMKSLTVYVVQTRSGDLNKKCQTRLVGDWVVALGFHLSCIYIYICVPLKLGCVWAVPMTDAVATGEVNCYIFYRSLPRFVEMISQG